MSNASAVMYEKGPVRVVEMFGDWCVRNTSGVVAQCLLTGLENGKEVAAANARRIAATWNACEGIPTEALEAGVVREMIEALELVLYQFDTPGYRHKLAVEKTRDVLRKLRGEASSTATNHDEEYEEWLRRAEEERYYNEYGREA